MEKTILCFGDSNTWGYIPGGMGGRHPREVRWAGRLGTLLGEGYHVIEEGLNNRTIVWEDPVRGFKSGLDYIVPCLQSHKPVDLLVVMLGSNDTKCRFNVNAYSIASSMMRFLDTVKASHAGINGEAPKILLVAPAPIRDEMMDSRLHELWDMDQASIDKSKMLGQVYRSVAAEYDCGFLDAQEFCQASLKDCLHLDAEGHRNLSNAVCAKVKEMVG